MQAAGHYFRNDNQNSKGINCATNIKTMTKKKNKSGDINSTSTEAGDGVTSTMNPVHF